MKIDLKTAADMLHANNDFHILAHKNPDGDTLGCAFGLWNILTAAGKRASVFCADAFPARYEFLYEGYHPSAEECGCAVAVDVADTKLLGVLAKKYAGGIALCIDHHITNTLYAEKTFVDPFAAAACELVYLIGTQSGFSLNKQAARCLYTGIATDSGCFRFSNTTPNTHIIASELLKYDIDFALINRKMFEIKSSGRIRLEAHLLENVEYFADGRGAMICFPQALTAALNIPETDFDGISSLPLQREGVDVAVTLREKEQGRFKISMRSPSKINVSAICSLFGGGGHINAAGCELSGSFEDVKKRIAAAVEEAMGINV